MPTNERRRPIHELTSDTQGAILVIGILGAALLGVLIYQMAEVGDAIIWRENGQSAADSAAFSSAVIQAQGMNALAFLNTIMAGVMALFIAWRILLMVTTAATLALAITCAAMMVPPATIGAGPVCTLAQRVAHGAQKLMKADKNVTKVAMTICSGINVLEKLVATVTPPIAMAYSMGSTAGYYDANFVLTLSPSIAPPPFPKISKDGIKAALSNSSIKEKVVECFEGVRKPKPGAGGSGGHGGSGGSSGHGGSGGSSGSSHGGHGGGDGHDGPSLGHTWDEVSQRRMGLFFSLPAQEDHLGKLCSKAGNFFDPIVAKWVKGSWAEPVWSQISVFKGIIFGTVPSLFCAPKDDALKTLTDDMEATAKKEAEKSCKKMRQEWLKLPKKEKEAHKYYLPGPVRGDTRPNQDHFNRALCKEQMLEERKKAQVDDAYADPNRLKHEKDTMVQCVKPARVWEITRNGNLFMHSFSWVNLDVADVPPGPPEFRATPDPGKEPPPRPKEPPSMGPAPPRKPKWIRAQAEMYFDCDAMKAEDAAAKGKAAPTKKAEWYEDCDPYAMWKMKWKARLRGVQTAKEMADEALATAFSSFVAIGSQEFLMEKIFHSNSKLGFDAKHGTGSGVVFYWIQEALRDVAMDEKKISTPEIH